MAEGPILSVLTPFGCGLDHVGGIEYIFESELTASSLGFNLIHYTHMQLSSWNGVIKSNSQIYCCHGRVALSKAKPYQQQVREGGGASSTGGSVPRAPQQGARSQEGPDQEDSEDEEPRESVHWPSECSSEDDNTVSPRPPAHMPVGAQPTATPPPSPRSQRDHTLVWDSSEPHASLEEGIRASLFRV